MYSMALLEPKSMEEIEQNKSKIWELLEARKEVSFFSNSIKNSLKLLPSFKFPQWIIYFKIFSYTENFVIFLSL